MVEGGETFLLLRRLNSGSSFDNGGNEKRIVNIDTTAGLINNFHRKSSFLKNREAIDCSATHLTRAKTILSVRSDRATYLCLKGGSHTDFYAV